MKDEPASSSHHRTGGAVRGNFLKLLGGRGAAAIFTFASTALMARALAPEHFGMVVMIDTYLLIMQGLVKLGSFHAVVRYGVPEQEAGNTDRLAQLLRITLTLDLAAALLGTVVACFVARLIGPHIGWDAQTTDLATLYSLLLLTGATGTSIGLLRLNDCFGVMARKNMLKPLIQLAGVASLWQLGVHDLRYFLIVTGASWGIGNLSLQFAAYGEHRKHFPDQRLLKGETWQDWAERFPGLLRFLHVVYWQGNLDLLPKRLSVFAAGLFLGPTMAGQFRLMSGLARTLAAPSLLLRNVLMADLARLWHRRDPEFARLLRRSLATSVGIGLCIALLAWHFGVSLLTLLAGAAYGVAAPAMAWLMLAAGLDMGTSTLRAAAYAMGNAHAVLKIHILAFVAFAVIFPLLTPAFQLVGAGIATAATAVITLVAMTLLVSRGIKSSPGRTAG